MTRFEPVQVATVADLVRALGGTVRLAQELHLSPSAISNWIAANEVPERWHARLLMLCPQMWVDWRPAYWDRQVELRYRRRSTQDEAA